MEVTTAKQVFHAHGANVRGATGFSRASWLHYIGSRSASLATAGHGLNPAAPKQ